MALVVAQEVPTSSSMAVPHGPAGVGEARRRMRAQLRGGGVAESVVDDAVLILSELLSNACKHGRPLGDAPTGDGDVRAAWRVDTRGRLVVEVTDGGGPTRPAPATPSVTARGGRGLNIIAALADDWGVRDDVHGEVTVWVVVHQDVRGAAAGCRPATLATRVERAGTAGLPEMTLADLTSADMTLPDLAAADVTHPDLTLPDLTCADVPLPDLGIADLTGAADATLPDLAFPDLALPDLPGLGLADAFEDLD